MKTFYSNYDKNDECQDEHLDELEYNDFIRDFKRFLQDRKFLLKGTVGTWQGDKDGGMFVFGNMDAIHKLLKDCDYISYYEDNGRLYVMGTHHDGTNHAELRLLTKKGEEYADRHGWSNSRETHETIFGNSRYSKAAQFSKWLKCQCC